MSASTLSRVLKEARGEPWQKEAELNDSDVRSRGFT